MKRVSGIALFTLMAACSAFALTKSDLDFRMRKLTMKFEAMQSKPDKKIPAAMLRKAQGVVLLDLTKAGFMFAYQGGNGVAMLKTRSGGWSPPAFFNANQASLGFQAGGQQTFAVILLMNTNALSMLTEGNFTVGGEARGTAGSNSEGAESGVSSKEQLTVIYTDREGLYGGAAIKGESLTPDTKANQIYYGDFLSTKEILIDHKGVPSAAAKDLAQKLAAFSK